MHVVQWSLAVFYFMSPPTSLFLPTRKLCVFIPRAIRSWLFRLLYPGYEGFYDTGLAF